MIRLFGFKSGHFTSRLQLKLDFEGHLLNSKGGNTQLVEEGIGCISSTLSLLLRGLNLNVTSGGSFAV